MCLIINQKNVKVNKIFQKREKMIDNNFKKCYNDVIEIKKKGSVNMSEKQQKILEIFKEILPQMPSNSQDYLLGYGEGMAAALKDNASEKTLEAPRFIQ